MTSQQLEIASHITRLAKAGGTARQIVTAIRKLGYSHDEIDAVIEILRDDK